MAKSKKVEKSSNKKRVSAEDFVVAWNKAASPDEVAKKLGMTREAALQKAGVFRRRGVKSLKVFPFTRGAKKLDISALNALASEALGKGKAKRA